MTQRTHFSITPHRIFQARDTVPTVRMTQFMQWYDPTGDCRFKRVRSKAKLEKEKWWKAEVSGKWWWAQNTSSGMGNRRFSLERSGWIIVSLMLIPGKPSSTWVLVGIYPTPPRLRQTTFKQLCRSFGEDCESGEFHLHFPILSLIAHPKVIPWMLLF